MHKVKIVSVQPPAPHLKVFIDEKDVYGAREIYWEKSKRGYVLTVKLDCEDIEFFDSDCVKRSIPERSVRDA